LAGVVIAAALFTRYVYVVAFKFASVLSSRELWDIGSNDVYEVEYGRYIAFQGFSGDPNLVGSATAIILFCGLAVRFRRYNMVRHLLNIFLVLVIFSSFSRGAISALAATFIITAYVTGNRQYRYYLAIIGAIFIAGLVWMVAGEFPSINPLDKFNQDFSRRIADWSTLINSVKANPILGCGLRCDEIMLGKYAENSYIAILVNIGLVGAALYYGIVLFVYCRFISNIREIIRQHENVLPWFSYTTYLILVMWFVSMDVKIHFWTALAVLAAFSIYSQRPRIRKLASETG
jgi:O-antigen ligase